MCLTAKKVKNFRIHPNYNVRAKVHEGVTEFYDYDVALIQLETGVQISTLVRWELNKNYPNKYSVLKVFNL